MAQRYDAPLALERMAKGRCPECGGTATDHLEDNRFWVPRSCTLTMAGVRDRIEQFEQDRGVQTPRRVV